MQNALKHLIMMEIDNRPSMQINKKCKWQRFQKVGECQTRGVRGVDYTKLVLGQFRLFYMKMPVSHPATSPFFQLDALCAT
jgi:hypothetical protein